MIKKAICLNLQCILMSIILVLTSGCALLLIGGGAVTGAGTVAYLNGELKSTENTNIDVLYDNVIKAIKNLEFYLIEQKKDKLTASIIARNSEDKKIVIRLRKTREDITELRIRVGMFGDEALSRNILNEIQKQK